MTHLPTTQEHTNTHSSFPLYLLHSKSLWQWLLIPPAASSSTLAQIPSDYTNDIIKYVCFWACACMFVFVSVGSIAPSTVYFRKNSDIINASSYNKQKDAWTRQSFSMVEQRGSDYHTKQMQSGFRDKACVSVNTGSTSVVLRATELQHPYMLICISSDKTHLEESIQALWHAKNNPTVQQPAEVSWLQPCWGTYPLLWLFIWLRTTFNEDLLLLFSGLQLHT